ncbi:MAG: hypothetical protein FJ144_26305 [Deltaproteobacteria bacterium]|nr:hypothetical protein [Deltaproteobacteria bacterium]
MPTLEKAILGRWSIVETEMWDREALDLVAPAHITFERDGLGQMELVAVRASIDYRVADRAGTRVIELSWAGFDEMDPVSGRAWAEPDGDSIRGKIFIHRGDESEFVAKRSRRRMPTSPSR